MSWNLKLKLGVNSRDLGFQHFNFLKEGNLFFPQKRQAERWQSSFNSTQFIIRAQNSTWFYFKEIFTCFWKSRLGFFATNLSFFETQRQFIVKVYSVWLSVCFEQKINISWVFQNWSYDCSLGVKSPFLKWLSKK